MSVSQAIILFIIVNLFWAFIFHSYRTEVKKYFRHYGGLKAMYTGDWWVTNHDTTPDNKRVSGPYSSSKDAGLAREIIERKTKSDINYWIEHLPEVKS